MKYLYLLLLALFQNTMWWLLVLGTFYILDIYKFSNQTISSIFYGSLIMIPLWYLLNIVVTWPRK